MSHFTSVTPNLLVSDVARSTAFYRDVLGFSIKENVPAVEPFVFVWLERDSVSVFLNDSKTAAAELPVVADRAFGGTAMLFVIVTDVDALHQAVAPLAPVVMDLKTQFYGMREFAVTDPDGHIITFAERVQQ
jgi:catechol 2,3-dioxygenase-like lactoylglutathione lyase family enzyme